MDTRSWKSKIVGSSKGKKKQVLITKGKNKGKYKTITDNKIETLEYVKNNLGISIISKFVAEPAYKNDEICILPLDDSY